MALWLNGTLGEAEWRLLRGEQPIRASVAQALKLPDSQDLKDQIGEDAVALVAFVLSAISSCRLGAQASPCLQGRGGTDTIPSLVPPGLCGVQCWTCTARR